MTKRVPFLLGLLSLAFLGAMLVVTIKKTQDLTVKYNLPSQAAPSAQLSLIPASTTINPSGTQNVDLVMTMTESNFSNADILLTLPLNAGILNASIIPNNQLNLSGGGAVGGWTFPFASALPNAQTNQIEIKLSVVNNTMEGAAPGTYTLATITLNADSGTHPAIPVSFDTQTTKVMSKSSAMNILTSSTGGSYQVGLTPTNTPIPPTLTPTNTPIPPTLTPTNTPIPPTLTPTNTPIPPTLTPTLTPIPPTLTPTNTPIPPTLTPTNTPIPPTLTPTLTPTPRPVGLTVNFRLQGITTASQAQTATITLRRSGQTFATFTLQAVNDSTGVYTITSPVANFGTGNFDVLVKTTNNLAKLFTNQSVTPDPVTNAATLSLTNRDLLSGDVNNDNLITIEDLSAISSKYVGAFSVPVPANTPEDVNRDGHITILDIALTMLNYQDFTVHGDN